MKTDFVNEQVPDATTFLKFRHMIEKKRDPEMHQTKMENEWKFGMKCNVGVDAGSGLVHSITATSADGEACSKRFLPDQGVSLPF